MRIYLALAVAAMTVAACGGGGGDTTTATISAQGGTLEVDGARLDIPAAALAEDMAITLRIAPFDGPELPGAVDTMVVIEPATFSLAHGATLSLALATPGEGEDVAAFQIGLDSGEWSELFEASVDPDGTITADVWHFGSFAVAVRPDEDGP